MRRSAGFLALLLLAPLPLAAPAAQACSLAVGQPFEQVTWISDNGIVTQQMGGVGVHDVVNGTTQGMFSALFVARYGVQPQGEWMIVSYWDGPLDADCSHPVEATHALNVRTLERVELFTGTARAFASNADDVIVFAQGCGGLVRYGWGEWDDPQVLDWPPVSRPDLEPHDMRQAALSPNGRHLAMLDDDHVRVFDLVRNELSYEARWAGLYHEPFPVFAFSADSARLALVALPDGSSTLTVLRLEENGWRLLSTRADPARAGQPVMTGGAAWRGSTFVVPAGSGLWEFRDPSNLSRTVVHAPPIKDAMPYGQPAWSPMRDRLVVGLQVQQEEGWSPGRLWLLDQDFMTLAEDEFEKRGGSSAWKEATRVEPACDVPAWEPPSQEPFGFAPGPAVVALLCALAIIALRRRP